jgi:tetratricopeptide (TPR) repeat protein
MYASDATLSVPAREPRKAALAPVVQQIILREARSIDDAVRIAKPFQAIATWTILIADAKTGEAAAIEITKGGVKLVRQVRHEPLAQTNHVFDKEQQAYAFFPSYNKYVETHTRMATLEKAFARLPVQAAQGDPFDAAKAIAQLANHDDVNGRFQPFGTTAVKSYDVMSTVMLPQARKIYMSVGDFSPSPHATFLGVQLDENLDPIALLGTLRDQSLAGTPGVLQSLNDYIQARLAYEFKNYDEAERLIRQAIAHASDKAANGADPAWAEREAGALRVYRYILARLLAMTATQNLNRRDQSHADHNAAYGEARQLFAAVINDPATAPYQRALAEYHAGLAELKFKAKSLRVVRMSPETAASVNHALGVFQSSYQDLKSSVDIKDMAADIANARKVLTPQGYRSLDAADIDWIVIR